MTSTPFVRRVLSVVSRIPPGKVATYGDVARLAGRPRAARAVGQIMSSAPRRGLPYHRVVAAGGLLGGYGGRIELKAALLTAEGLTVGRLRIREFSRHRWSALAASRLRRDKPAGAKPGLQRRKPVQRGRKAPRLTK